MNVDAFDYDLPEQLIAQEPLERRDDARLLVLDRVTGATTHRVFRDLAEELRAGDLLVLNDTRVLPARLRGEKESGGRVEMLLVEAVGGSTDEPEWRCLLSASRPPRPGATLRFRGGLTALVAGREGEEWIVRLRHPSGDPMAQVAACGEMPLPPYIRRREGDPRAARDRERYQTVFAREPGAVAAPTAGLHLTEEFLGRLEPRGVGRAMVTLHVGPGTFLPVRSARVEEHRMHEEAFAVPEATAAAIARTRRDGGRVVAVGTTVVRALETAAQPSGEVRAGTGRTSLFVVPGYRFAVVDALVTNFHLPRSTLVMLVAAFAGRDALLAAYRDAVRAGYRFYSYGDAMFVRGT